jgi:hypothetical protein
MVYIVKILPASIDVQLERAGDHLIRPDRIGLLRCFVFTAMLAFIQG